MGDRVVELLISTYSEPFIDSVVGGTVGACGVDNHGRVDTSRRGGEGVGGPIAPFGTHRGDCAIRHALSVDRGNICPCREGS
jgi:hypothetical protein